MRIKAMLLSLVLCTGCVSYQKEYLKSQEQLKYSDDSYDQLMKKYQKEERYFKVEKIYASYVDDFDTREYYRLKLSLASSLLDVSAQEGDSKAHKRIEKDVLYYKQSISDLDIKILDEESQLKALKSK